jgi:SAM-dependent methyltransferase
MIEFKVIKKIFNGFLYARQFWWNKFSNPLFWGSFRNLQPKSRIFGYDRGTQSIARYYIDNFVERYASDIHGHVLEVGDNRYISRYGKQITHSDILHVNSDNPHATIVTDLTRAGEIPSNIFDCIVITQTFQFIYDSRSALGQCYRILKPGGVMLATFSGISQISEYDMERWGEYWRFTSRSVHKLFTELFPEENIIIDVKGNVLAAISLLEGLASSELSNEELNYCDPAYEIIGSVEFLNDNQNRE